MKKWYGGLLAGLLFSLSALAAVNINTATPSELEKVHGIGPAKARAIVEYRQQHGAFKSVDDLVKVKGFGEATVNKLRDYLTVGDKDGKTPAGKQ